MPEMEKLSFGTKVAYGIGDLGLGITGYIRAFFLLVFLTNVAGMNPSLAGAVLSLGRIWDTIIDPLIGALSDRTRSRWGRRHSWMIYSGIPFGIFFFLQWIVPRFSTDSASNQGSLFWYYLGIAIAFDTLYTAVGLPYAALVPELTQDYHERTSLISFKSAFAIGGGIFALVLAQAIFLMIPDASTKYLVLGLFGAVFSVLPIYLCVWGTLGVGLQANNSYPHNSASISIFSQLRIVFSNRPFLFVIGIYFWSWLAVQVNATILPYFVVNWMQLPDRAFIQAALTVQVTALIMMFVWGLVSKRLEKKTVYFLGMPLWIIAQTWLFFIQPGQINLMYCLAVLAGVGVSTAYVVPWSMLPDIIDLDELNTGERREGIYYAFVVQLHKVGSGIGILLIGKVLDLAGFIPTVAGKTVPIQPESALWAIRGAIAIVPILTLTCGLILTYFYPITRDVHSQILMKLQERRNSQNHNTGF